MPINIDPRASLNNQGAGSSISDRQRGLLKSEQGYSPFWRTAAIGITGATALQMHASALRTFPSYASKLYHLAERFEEMTPFRWGRTFGLSERASSYVLNDIRFTPGQLIAGSQLTELGSHFQRLLGRQIDVAALAPGGLHFFRPPGEQASPFLRLEGFEQAKVRFSKIGRFTGASARYNRPLESRSFFWNQSQSFTTRLWENYRSIRESQMPFNPIRGVKGLGADLKYAPWYASTEATAETSLSERVTIGANNLRRSIEPQAFELLERPQKMLAEIGIGLRQGSFNKLFNVPFVGEGGLINGVLLKRVLPIAIGLTAIRYLDYKTGHVGSNAVINAPLKANLLRADLTDILPGARSLTDWYSREEGDLPQYAPFALPLGGMFVGGLIHFGQVVTGKFSGTTRLARTGRDLASRILPRMSVLRRAARTTTTKEALRLGWKAFGTPGKGGLIGLALMLPFIPGMLGSRKTGTELRRVYSGEEEVPIRQGRWWEVGSTKWSGNRIIAWRPHASVLMKSHAREKSLYGSEQNYWSHNPILHPFKWLKDPYYLEKLHEADRPYPITSPAFSNVPLIGSLLAATIGKVIKPPLRMHTDEWDAGSDYTLYSSRLEPRGPDALPPAVPEHEFSLWHAFKREAFTMSDYIGLPGFIMRSIYGKAYPGTGKQPVYLQGSRQMDSTSRAYYEQNIGSGYFISPEGAFMGYTEPLRRFIQPEGYTPQVNEIRNTMPSWMPGADYLIDFSKGDPYTKVDQGFARLPGAGYEALHPEIEGLNPEDYPNIHKMRILADVAPYSREYQRWSSIVRHEAKDNPDLLTEYQRITEQVKQTKESTLQLATKHFNAPIDTLEGTVKSASFEEGVQLAEYPGRTFRFSSVGGSMADLTADMLGSSNTITRSQAVRQADIQTDMRDQYLADVLAEGTHIKLVVPRGAADNSSDIRAVIMADNLNVNRAMIEQGYGRFRQDLGGAEEQAMHGWFGRLFGKYTEEMFFEGDQSPFNPMRYVPTPFHTKLAQERTPLSQYIQQEVTGTRMRRWNRPIHDFLQTYMRGVAARVSGVDEIPKEIQHRRDLDTLTDMLAFLRGEESAATSDEDRGRYTSQAKRTNIGANLYGSAAFITSTLSSREARYFKQFVQETDPEVRERILGVVPEESRLALEAQWELQKERIAEAEGQPRKELGAQGRPYTEEDVEEYKQAKTQLQLGDYLRSRQIARFFFTRKFRLPTEEDSAALDSNLDYQDVKLKLVQQEGYDAHDFNLFQDRADTLWRKPYVDGAVRELTSGDSRTQEQMRQAVEQIIISAGNPNPDVRYTTRKAHRSRANVTVDADTDYEHDMLVDMRRNSEEYQE